MTLFSFYHFPINLVYKEIIHWAKVKGSQKKILVLKLLLSFLDLKKGTETSVK